MDQTTSVSCPLCLGDDTAAFHADRRRTYRRCGRCLLVFVPPEQHLSLGAEKSIYDLHRNDPADSGYRRFLSRLLEPLAARLPDGASGLDFGCGPGPALAAMMSERGFDMRIYDPFYADDPALLERRYDFITATEVIEHFRTPRAEFERLFALLKPGGLLGVMTKRVIDREAFARWHYKNDLTHISFFSIPTLRWLAERYRCRVDFVQSDVAVFQLA